MTNHMTFLFTSAFVPTESEPEPAVSEGGGFTKTNSRRKLIIWRQEHRMVRYCDIFMSSFAKKQTLLRAERLTNLIGSSTVSPLEHLSMSSDDWSQAATLAWLLELKGNAPAECTVDCLRIDMHCSRKQTQRSVQ